MKISKKAHVALVVLLISPLLTAFADRGGWRDGEDDSRGRGSWRGDVSSNDDSRRWSSDDDSDSENRWRGSDDSDRNSNSWRWRSWILRPQDEDRVNRAFDRINDKINFVQRVVDRIDKLIVNINWSNMTAEVKARRVAILQDIKSILLERLQEFENVWDNRAPVISSLLSVSISSSQASFNVNVNKAWVWYFVVLPSWSWAPTATQVKAWTDSSWATAAIKWNLNLVAWNNSFSVSWLSSATSYRLYFTAQDNSWNLRNDVASLNFTTNTSTADSTPPSFVASLSWTTSSWANISVNMSEVWKWYYLALPNWSWTPTAVQVKAWTDSSWDSAAIKWSVNLVAWANMFSVIGLSPSTSYILFFAAEDIFANLNSSVGSLGFTTTAVVADNIPPTFTLSLSWVTSGGITASVNSNEIWKWYFVILLNWSWTPSASQIKAWTDSNWATASIKWSMDLVVWSNLFWVGWLTPNTSYIIFYAAEDASLNLQGVPVSAWFLTAQ